MDKVYSVREILDIVNCSESTISLYRKMKLIKGKRIGNRHYYTEAEVEKIQETYENNMDVKGSLCWLCANAYNGCSWSRRFEPVPGWDAEKVVRDYIYRDYSYVVKSCPQFKKEKDFKK